MIRSRAKQATTHSWAVSIGVSNALRNAQDEFGAGLRRACVGLECLASVPARSRRADSVGP